MNTRKQYQERVAKVNALKAQVITAACKKENAVVFHAGGVFAQKLWAAAQK
jgi:hypothetical protein